MSHLFRRCPTRLLPDLSTTTTAITTCSLTTSRLSGQAPSSRLQKCNQREFQSVALTPHLYSPSAASVTATPTSKNGGFGGHTLQITEKCKQRLRQILDKKDSFLRVSVEGGGCSGFQYKFDIDTQMCSEDIVISKEGGGGGVKERDSALVVIDEISLDLVRGSTLDYETELIRSTFRIVNNPHAEQGCSCGASFNMKL